MAPTRTEAPSGTTSKQPSELQEKEIRRMKNTTANLPIVYGSIAFHLGKKKADEYNTHEWTLFVRGPNQEDFSPVISKVVFQLHPSFNQPTREFTQPPYEVTERGWGEFEAQIRIHWTDDSHEQSTIVNHTIKLYPPGTPPNLTTSSTKSASTPTVDKPVLAEVYDEIVFTDPTETFFEALKQIEKLPKIELTSTEIAEDGIKLAGTGTDGSTTSQLKKEHVPYYDDEEDFLSLLSAQKFLKDELSKVKRRFENVTEEMETIDRSIASAAPAAAAAAAAVQRSQRAREAAHQAALASAAAAPSSSGTTTGGGTSTGTGSTKKRAPSTTSKTKKPVSKKTKTGASSATTGGGGSSSSAKKGSSK